MINQMRIISEKIRRIRFAKFKNDPSFQDDITIICNNCTAGILYKTFDLQFLTPTINLSFGRNNDFYYFVSHLKEYTQDGRLIQSNLIETHPDFKNAPIGILKCKGLPDVEIHFLHYKTFDEANRKWYQRISRINWGKIFVLIEANNPYEHTQIENYKKIAYPRMILTDLVLNSKDIKHMHFYDKYGTDIHNPILKLTNILGKRGIDEYHFVQDIFCRKY